MSRLIVLMNGVEAGHLDYEQGRLSFTYSEDWRSRDGAVPLSLSMSLAAATHTGAPIAPNGSRFSWSAVCRRPNDLSQ